VIVGRHGDVLSVRKDATAAASDAALDKSLASAAPERDWHWRESPQLELTVPFAGTLVLEPDRHGPLDLDALPDVLSVRGRRGGEALRPAVGARTRKLKALLQEAKVPAPQRETLPLIYANDKLIAVSDRWLDASVQATRATKHRARLRLNG